MRLDGDQKRLPFRRLSTFGTVPVLLDGTTSIAQSYAALLWIGEKNGALLPRARARRARVLAWVAASATELDPPVRRAYDEAYFTEKPNAARVRLALDQVRSALDRLERARAAEPKRRYLAGGSPTIADAALLPSFWLAKDLADDFPRALPEKRWPILSKWYQCMVERSDVAAVLAAAEA